MKHGLLRRICILATLFVMLSLAAFAAEGNSFDYVIATTAPMRMTKLLGYSDTVDASGYVVKTAAEKYYNDLTKGIYIDDNGYAAIAVLDTATGRWRLAAVKNFWYGDYDAVNAAFDRKLNLGESAKYYDMIGSTYTNAAKYNAQRDALNNSAVFFVVNEQDGVYDLAAAPGYNMGNKTTPNLVAGSTTEGLIFSADSPETNAIRANDDDDAARVTLTADTIIAVINGNEVYVRAGVQKSKRSLALRSGSAYFLAANSSLIIMDVAGATLQQDGSGRTALDTEWYGSALTDVTETFYVALAGFSVVINAADDDTYTVTLNDLFDLRTLQPVVSVTVTEDSMNKALTHKRYAAGDVLHLDDEGHLSKYGSGIMAADAARLLVGDDDNKNVDMSTVDFIDGDSIAMILADGTMVDSAKANKINIKVVTLGTNIFNTADYDTDNAIVTNVLPTGLKDGEELYKVFKNQAQMQEFSGYSAGSYFCYPIGSEGIVEIAEPTADVFNNFIVYMNGANILIPGVNEDYSDYTSLSDMVSKTADYEIDSVRLSAYAKYDADKCTVDMVVFKLGPVAHTHNFDTLLSETPATVFKTGERKRACSACGAVEVRVLPKLTAGSNIGKVAVTVTDADGAAIDGALLTLIEADGTTHELLPEANSVEQPLYVGDYTVRATVFGCPSVSETFAVSAGQTTEVTLRVEQPAHAGAFYGAITEFVEAKDRYDVDTLRFVGYSDSGRVDYDGSTIWYSTNLEFAAADLGITRETPKVDYLGRNIMILVDKKAEDFEKTYDVIAADSGAHVVFASVQQDITVENLGAAGNIKWDSKDEILTLGDARYTAKNNNFYVYTFKGATSSKPDAGWERVSLSTLTDNFVYDAKDGYVGGNSYGKVEYHVVKTEAGEKDIVYIYYTPYEFGQYFSRRLQYQPTSKYENFVTVGAYDAAGVKNLDGVETKFVERMIGTNFRVADGVKSVNKTYGETAMNTKLAGERIRSGDFMFYAYNMLDNVLTVAQVGSLKEGRLTSYNLNKETVKIDGTDKVLAFKGAYEIAGQVFRNPKANAKNLCEMYDGDITAFIRASEHGKNNVRYVELDGNVVYMDAVPSKAYNEGNSLDYVIATTDPERMAKLLGYTDTVDASGYVVKTAEEKYAADLIKGIYMDENEHAAIAVLDTATGKWKLAAVKNFWYGDYDADNAAFDRKINLGESAKYYDMIGSTYTNAAKYNAQRDALNNSAVFFVVGEQDGVYDLAAVPAYNAGSRTTPNLVAGSTADGLVFADGNAKTNKIQATNNEDDAARVTLHCETVIVVIGGNRVYVRVGRRMAADSIEVAAGSAYFLAASDSLIVMDITGATLREPNVLEENWAGDVESAGHDFVTVAAAVEPTYTTPGSTACKRCTRCGITVGGEEIPMRSARPGDVNGDDAVSKLDLLRLQKYLAGWDVEIALTAADTNGDGAVNKADLLRLQKYLAGWDVPLGK